MDYLINEGYPDAAMNFAKEASIVPSADGEAIQERVDIRNAIHTGDMQLAIERINELNPQVSHYPASILLALHTTSCYDYTVFTCTTHSFGH
jgi:hypothetical protein